MGKDKVMKALGEFGIEVYFELYHDNIVKGLRNYLMPITPAKMKQMVQKNQAITLPPDFLATAKGYEDYLDIVTPQRLFEVFAEARPDLGAMLEAMGEDGAEYVVLFHRHFVESIKATPLQEEKSISQEIKDGRTVKLTCDKCGHTWTATPKEAAAVTECPECHAPAGDEPEELAQDEEETGRL
jgi:rubrerythrin